MTNIEIFLDKFNILERILKDKFNIKEGDEGAVKQIEKFSQFSFMKNQLSYIRKIRNYLAHSEKIRNEHLIYPTDELIKMVQDVIDYINNPPKVYDKCIKIQNVYSAMERDLIYPSMIEMKQNVYTHVPILENGVVKGVFSENTLFGALLEDELIYDKKKTTFNEPLIKKYCTLNNHVSEVFEFISRDMYLEDVKQKFLKSFEKQERLAMLFITQNGKPTEKLLGIITPWDVLGKK